MKLPESHRQDGGFGVMCTRAVERGRFLLNRRLWVVLEIALCSLGCVVTTMYGHRTMEGAPFRFDGLGELTEGMSFEQVRKTLGTPLEEQDAAGVSMWRYFERANPRWCDGGSSKAVPPEYSIQAILIFRDGALLLKDVKQTGKPNSP